MWWVNGIEHEVYDGTSRRHLMFNVVVCEERWWERHQDGTAEEKTSLHAWISGHKLTEKNVHRRCNLAARHRWDIEEANVTTQWW